MITRDSISLTLTAIVAGLTYLLTMPPPQQWSYYDWLHVALAACLWLSGKAATSWLKGKSDIDRVTVPKE